MKKGDFVTMLGNDWAIYKILYLTEDNLFSIIIDINELANKEHEPPTVSMYSGDERAILVSLLKPVDNKLLNEHLANLEDAARLRNRKVNMILSYQLERLDG